MDLRYSCPPSLITFPRLSIASMRVCSQADMDKLERKLAHKEGELDMLQIANEALQAQAKVRETKYKITAHKQQ